MPSSKFSDAAADEKRITVFGRVFRVSKINNLQFNPETGKLKLEVGNGIHSGEGETVQSILKKLEEKGRRFIPARTMSTEATEKIERNIFDERHGWVQEESISHFWLDPENYILNHSASRDGKVCLQDRLFPSCVFYPVKDDLETPVSMEEFKAQWTGGEITPDDELSIL